MCTVYIYVQYTYIIFVYRCVQYTFMYSILILYSLCIDVYSIHLCTVYLYYIFVYRCVQYTFMYSILILYSLCTVYLYYIVYVQYT